MLCAAAAHLGIGDGGGRILAGIGQLHGGIYRAIGLDQLPNDDDRFGRLRQHCNLLA